MGVRVTQQRDADFTHFVEVEYDRLARAAVLLAGSRTAGEDLLQEGLVRTYLHWDQVRAGGAAAYTRTVLVNLQTDQWRRRHLEPVLGDEGDQHPSKAADRARGVVEDRDEILRGLRLLTPRERAMIVLRYYYDLTERQVADELGVSLGTVKSTCSRARARLGAIAEDAGRVS